MELWCRAQKANEPYKIIHYIPRKKHSLIDNFKTEVLVNVIRDIKLAVCSTQKITFAETVACALAQS